MNPFPIFDTHIHTYGTFLERTRSISDYMDQHNIRKAVITTTNKSANPKAFSDTKSDDGKKGKKQQTFQNAVQQMSNGQLDHSDVDAAAERFPDRFVKFFWFNPKVNSDQKGRDFKVLEQHFNKGYRGVKLHSGIHLAKIPDDVIELVEFMQAYNTQLPLYVHSTPAFSLFQGISGMDFFKLAKRFPDLKIIIGHAGFAMEYAIELGFLLKTCDNVFFETSCSSPYAILSLLKMAGHHRVLFGSDAPITNPVQVEIDKIMSLPISEEQTADILYRNTEKLLADNR